MAVEDVPRLGCGRSIDQIWATIDQPPNTHEQKCEQCHTARERLKKLNEATRSLRESDLHNDSLKPRVSVLDGVMDVARAEIRRSSRILMHNQDHGTTEISEQALSSVIRFAAKAVPGVHARRCHIQIRSSENELSSHVRLPAHPHATNNDPRLIINLRVAAASNIDIPRTVDSVRQRINSAIAACVGINAGTINITVEDLYDV